MEKITGLACPKCSARLHPERRIRIGSKITCATCKIAFTVRPEDAKRVTVVNRRRLGIIITVASLYLLTGTVLAIYCFKNNVPRDAVARTESGSEDNESDSDTKAASVTPPTAPRLGRVSAEEERKIDKAIADGVWYLKDHMLPEGTWKNTSGVPALEVGLASLSGLTLLECGVPANDPVVNKAAELVRRDAAQLGGNGRATYQMALAILFLDRLGAYQDTDLIQYLALSLIAGQRANGDWLYQCPRLDRAMVPQLLEGLGDPTQSLEVWHKTALNRPMERGSGDNSNTQFAILALWVAQRHQVPIGKPIELMEKHFRTTQLHGRDGAVIADSNNVNLDGSWYYSPGRNAGPWPSMTCSGLLGLAISHGVVSEPREKNQKPLDDPDIKAGLAMLAREIDRPGERRSPDHYFLWSLQRVGVLYDLELIDGKDWYGWGCKILLPRQKNDGSWSDFAFYDNNPVVNTCFALLFLKRANLAKDLTDKLQLLARQPANRESRLQAPADKDENRPVDRRWPQSIAYLTCLRRSLKRT